MVLVTGGSGLLGKELITQLLAQGKSVTAIYNKTPLSDFHNNHIKQVQCNILDVVGLEEVMQNMEQVYHCAAIVSLGPRMRKELFKINVEGTANVVNAALDAGVKKMIYVSSVAALGRIRENEFVNETMYWSKETSNSAYGQSKYLGEMEVWRGIGEGLNAVIVNPSIILGAGNWESGSSRIFKNVYEEFPWYTDGISGFVDVRDVANAMILLMESDIISERFIVSAANISYQEIFNLIAKSFGKRQPHKKVTPLIAQIVWRLERLKSMFTGKEPLITKETALTAMAKMHFDNTKLLKFLHNFKYRSIEDTIEYTCKMLQQQLQEHH